MLRKNKMYSDETEYIQHLRFGDYKRRLQFLALCSILNRQFIN